MIQDPTRPPWPTPTDDEVLEFLRLHEEVIREVRALGRKAWRSVVIFVLIETILSAPLVIAARTMIQGVIPYGSGYITAAEEPFGFYLGVVLIGGVGLFLFEPLIRFLYQVARKVLGLPNLFEERYNEIPR